MPIFSVEWNSDESAVTCRKRRMRPFFSFFLSFSMWFSLLDVGCLISWFVCVVLFRLEFNLPPIDPPLTHNRFGCERYEAIYQLFVPLKTSRWPFYSQRSVYNGSSNRGGVVGQSSRRGQFDVTSASIERRHRDQWRGKGRHCTEERRSVGQKHAEMAQR